METQEAAGRLLLPQSLAEIPAGKRLPAVSAAVRAGRGAMAEDSKVPARGADLSHRALREDRTLLIVVLEGRPRCFHPLASRVRACSQSVAQRWSSLRVLRYAPQQTNTTRGGNLRLARLRVGLAGFRTRRLFTLRLANLRVGLAATQTKRLLAPRWARPRVGPAAPLLVPLPLRKV